jgi:peroxin-10
MLLQILAPLALPCLSSYLRRRIDRLSSSQDPADSPRIQRLQRLLQLTQNQAVQALPEIWFTWWLIGGSRMLDVGKWLTGMDYVSFSRSDVLAACLESTVVDFVPQISSLPPPRPGQPAPPTYEPVGFLILLPLIARLWPRRDDGTLASPWPRREADKVQDASVPLESSHAREFTIDGLPAVETSETTDPNPHNHTLLSDADLALPQRRCPLCLTSRGTTEESGGTAVTECGHIFCWSCIQDWAQEKVRRGGWPRMILRKIG